VGVLAEDSLLAEHRAAGAFLAAVVDDALDDGGDALAVEGGLEVCPAGKRREDDALAGGEVGDGSVFSSASGLVEGSAIEPGAFEVGAREQCVRAVNARPVLRAFDQTFFDPVAQGIGEARDLGLLLVGNDDGAIAPGPNFSRQSWSLPTSRAMLPATKSTKAASCCGDSGDSRACQWDERKTRA